MKNMNPGPTLFTQNPQNIYAVYLLFIVANILMIPLGWLCIKAAKQILRVPRNVLMPLILLFCIVGTFAINNTVFDVGVMLIAGVVAYVLEENGFPSAPAILGVVLGGMLEENFITSMIKSDGNLLGFFSRPIAASLGALTLCAWFLPPRHPAAAATGRRVAELSRRGRESARGRSRRIDPLCCDAVKSSGFDRRSWRGRRTRAAKLESASVRRASAPLAARRASNGRTCVASSSPETGR